MSALALPASVFFGTPTYDKTVTIDHDTSMIESAILLTQLGVRLQRHAHAGGIYLGLIRNAIVDVFLASDADDLIFVDADVGFDPRCLPRLLTYPQEVVGGLVPKRNTDREDDFHTGAMTGTVSDNGLFQTLEIPTAFLRIKRSAFAKIQKPYFRSEADPTAYGEDIWFCRRWCETGNFLWIDADITFSHRGSRAWRGNFYDHCVATGLLRKAA